MKIITPRTVTALLSQALTQLDAIEPPALREPVRDILRAGIELCVTSGSLLGTPIVNTIRIAEVLADTGKTP